MFHEKRLARIEAKLDKLIAMWETPSKPKLQADAGQPSVGRVAKGKTPRLPVILDIMKDGKIWAVSAIWEEMTARGIDIRLNDICSSLASNARCKHPLVERTSLGAYRLIRGA